FNHTTVVNLIFNTLSWEVQLLITTFIAESLTLQYVVVCKYISLYSNYFQSLLNSLVDSIKFLFSAYTENMIEVFKVRHLLDKAAKVSNYIGTSS
ncbi:hypothetical protein L9F63_009481, partial [Diploptera punctata]